VKGKTNELAVFSWASKWLSKDGWSQTNQPERQRRVLRGLGDRKGCRSGRRAAVNGEGLPVKALALCRSEAG
jgi:hypothetical protein